MTRLPVTAAGHIALEEELRRRIRVARPSLVRRIRQAISDEANLVENSEYQAALAEQELNETRIADLRQARARRNRRRIEAFRRYDQVRRHSDAD